MGDRVSGHIITYTGKLIEPLNPDPALIDIVDITHALSNCCRFCGHVRTFYSVAQHSVLASRIVPVKHALTALLHDASEAYLSDIASPIKQQPEFGTVYKAAEERLMHAIAETFGIDWPMPHAVKRADMVLLRTEQRDLMPSSPDLRSYRGEFTDPIKPWRPTWAKAEFMWRYQELTEAAAA